MTLTKVMGSSDQQIPYHDKRMLNLYFKVMKWFKPDQILLVGDHADHAELGRWEEGGTREFLNSLPEPLEQGEKMFEQLFTIAKPTKEFYEQHREICPDAKVDVALGNHDWTRVYKYFDKKVPEMLQYATPNALWGFDDLGFDYIHYEDRPKHVFGGLHIHHGVAISKHAGESVKADVENFGVSIYRGHSHRLSQVSRTYTLRNETLVGIEGGHMMDVNSTGASYDNVHNWQPGFVIFYVEDGATDTADGLRFHPQLIPISRDYTCVVDGKLFKA